MSGKNRNCFESELGVWTKPVYKTSWASLPAKQATTVGSSLGFNMKLLHDWSNFDLPKLTPVQQISLMPSSCLSLTNTRQDTSQKVTRHGSSNQEFADASVHSDEQKGILIEGVPYPLSPIPPFFLPIPYPFRCLLCRLWQEVQNTETLLQWIPW